MTKNFSRFFFYFDRIFHKYIKKYTFAGFPVAVQTKVSSSFISRLVIVQSGLSADIQMSKMNFLSKFSMEIVREKHLTYTKY